MGIDITALTTNANKLDECIDKKQEQDRKDEQLYCIIERKVKKEEHKREKPRSRDGALKKCERLFEGGASSEVLTKLEESLREQEKYYRYYVQCFLPVLDEVIERSKKISNETKKQVISKITYNSKYCSNSITHNQNDRRNSEDSEAESGYGSDVEDDHKVEISNEITNNNPLLLKVIKNRNNRKFKKYLKDCTDISSIKNEKGNNILHLIVTQLEKKQKFDFLNTVLNVSKKEELKAQLEKAVNDKNGNGQTPLQALLLSKVTKEKHSFETTPRKTLTPLKKLIPHYDNTIVSAIQLLKLGANIDDLQLSKEELQNLKEEQKTYYRNFLEKLAEQGKKSKLKPEIKINIEAKIKEIILRTINTPDSNDNYQLHLAIKNNDKERFKELLQKGADISLKDGEGNNALHLIVTKLEREQRLKFLSISLEVDQKEQFIKAVNDKNDNEQTPLHRLLQHIKEKNEDRSCTDRKFEKTNRYKALELFLQNGADITVQDKDGKNALHYIASFKGEQKVTCSELILGLVENGTISKDKLGEAINAKNGEGSTPLELALKKKAEKRSIEYPSQGTIFDLATNYDSTTKFCAALLQNGANPDSLWLEDPKFHTKKYYLTLRDLKDYSGTPQKAQEKAKELKEKLEEKYHCGTASKKCQSGIKKLGSGIKKGVSATEEVLSAVGKYINPAERTRELLAITITITVIAMVTFAFFQGQMAIGAAIPIIATAGVICLTLTLGFSGIKKLFEKSTNKAQDTFNDKNLSNSTTEQNQASKNPIDNDQQNLGNDSEDLAAKRQRNQSEYTENPATKISDVSILRQFMNKLGFSMC
ncbi:ankyrin repeat domain-containing protein [Wolbachia endosymbiont of Oedothorax gibbosus]|uniref:ankyrin repeat domain-containing protein n=1 Tax=Wolbachia endosymbiont of Oedothorax gibbosus TaxID=931100 RepID=UPI002024EF31|nr:ankyrin repeat domain-containing protein [Wolbachia endosymbiont of Oedothorax gibbosus]